WVVAEACRQVRACQVQYPSAKPLVLNVNLSTRELHSPKLVEEIRGILRRTGFDPAHLQVEITESILMADPAANLQPLEKLMEINIKLALDDFGTGYSSLAYL